MITVSNKLLKSDGTVEEREIEVPDDYFEPETEYENDSTEGTATDTAVINALLGVAE